MAENLDLQLTGYLLRPSCVHFYQIHQRPLLTKQMVRLGRVICHVYIVSTAESSTIFFCYFVYLFLKEELSINQLKIYDITAGCVSL